MSTVNVLVNGKNYSIGCASGDEEEVEAYAKKLDKKLLEFNKENPSLASSLSREEIFLLMLIIFLEKIETMENKAHNEVHTHKQDSDNEIMEDEVSLEFLTKLVQKINSLEETFSTAKKQHLSIKKILQNMLEE